MAKHIDNKLNGEMICVGVLTISSMILFAIAQSYGLRQNILKTFNKKHSFHQSRYILMIPPKNRPCSDTKSSESPWEYTLPEDFNSNKTYKIDV